jgi:hypothetical protein
MHYHSQSDVALRFPPHSKRVWLQIQHDTIVTILEIPRLKRPRPIYFIAILVVITLGLLSRRYPQFLPAALGKYPGDALWALMVFFGFGFWFNRVPTVVVALAAFAFSVAMEVSQLYHAPWIDSVRATLPGRLVLGRGFAWGDIAAYSVGISIGVLTEFGLFRRVKK